MLELTGLYASTILIVGIYVLATLRWHGRFGRLLPVTTLVVVCLLAYLALAELLGRPRPTSISSIDRADLITYVTDGETMWVWVRVAGGREPLSLSFPYSYEMAQQFAGQREEMERGAVEIRREEGPHHDGEWVAYPKPHLESPPKTAE